MKVCADLYFLYLGLDERLKQFRDNNVRDIDINLIISLEKEYYMGENMKLIMRDLRKLMDGKKIIRELDGKLEEFYIKKLGLFVGDTLNHYMFYYRHCANYFDEHNIDEEELIPLKTRQEFEKISYLEGTQEGKDWFKDNLEAIQLFSDEKQLTKDFIITDDITTIFEETETTPGLEYICYNHWYNHPRYKEIEKDLHELINMEDSIINRCYDYEAEYFYDRLDKRGETPKYKDLFVQQSKKYLIDETIPTVIINSKKNPNNFFDMYYYGKLPHHLEVYKGKKTKKNEKIQKYIKEKFPKIDDCFQISIRMRE